MIDDIEQVEMVFEDGIALGTVPRKNGRLPLNVKSTARSSHAGNSFPCIFD